MTEMLLQSYQNEIFLFPAVPKALQTDLSFSGLKARGDRTVSGRMQNRQILQAEIACRQAGPVSVIAAVARSVRVLDADGRETEVTVEAENRISFEGGAGQTYRLTGFSKTVCLSPVQGLTGRVEKDSVTLCWQNEPGLCYRVERAFEFETRYTLLATVNSGTFSERVDLSEHTARYRVTARDPHCPEAVGESACFAAARLSELEKDRYAYRLRQNNL